MSKEAKHPARVQRKVAMRNATLAESLWEQALRPLRHLREGRIYKLTFELRRYDYALCSFQRDPNAMITLYSDSSRSQEIGFVKTGKTVVFLGYGEDGLGLHAKIIYEDVVGWVRVREGMRFRRITTRMMSRS